MLSKVDLTQKSAGGYQSLSNDAIGTCVRNNA